MPIEDVFGIKGRGTVVTGRVERGVVKPGEEIEIVGLGERRKVVVTGVEMFQKTLDEGQAGDNVGCLLRGWSGRRGAGQVLAKPGWIHPHTKFQAEVYVLAKEEGGGTRRSSRLPAAVLHPHHRCDRLDHLAGGDGDGDAGGQRADGGGADHAGGDRRGAALRHPRGRPHRRRRRRHHHRRVVV